MKNWKTTVLGAIAAAFIAIHPLISTGEVDWKAVGIAAVVALFGYLTKDAGVSGTQK
jgi:hypothetical protein